MSGDGEHVIWLVVGSNGAVRMAICGLMKGAENEALLGCCMLNLAAGGQCQCHAAISKIKRKLRICEMCALMHTEKVML